MSRRGSADPVRISNTNDIDGDLVEPDDVKIIEITDQQERPVGLLIKWEIGCWIWADDDSTVDLKQME